MKVLLCLFSIALVVESARKCKPKFHYWRPWSGSIPDDAFVAAIDSLDGTRSYIARIFLLEDSAWTVPVQFKQNSKLHFKWCCSPNTRALNYSPFIEILCSESSENFMWYKVEREAKEATEKCCLAIGGLGWNGEKSFKAYIGRGVKDGRKFIGNIFEGKMKGLHYMDNDMSRKIDDNYEVLTYACGG